MNRRKLFAAALMGSAAAMAQSTSSSSREVHVMTQSMSSGPGQAVWIGEGGGSGATAFAFIAGGNMGGKVVKGVPYSAEATTEMTRTLADGTRIINKHVTQMARDKEGRTRRENVLNGVGPFQSGGSSAPRLVTITDPVAKEVYILNYNDKTARKVKMGEPAVFRSEKVEGHRTEVIEEKVHVEVRGKTATAGGAPDFLFHSPVAGAHVGGAAMGAVS
ncbi:MAG: hypothetical protein JNK48_21075, partial [Bryobacterales bacterium]|nr:hypothetical protein [Bryobacterales bacterium]